MSNRQTCFVSYTNLILTGVVLRGEIEVLEITSDVMCRPSVGILVVVSGQSLRGVECMQAVLSLR
jgi:hypothetical protein